MVTKVDGIVHLMFIYCAVVKKLCIYVSYNLCYIFQHVRMEELSNSLHIKIAWLKTC